MATWCSKVHAFMIPVILPSGSGLGVCNKAIIPRKTWKIIINSFLIYAGFPGAISVKFLKAVKVHYKEFPPQVRSQKPSKRENILNTLAFSTSFKSERLVRHFNSRVILHCQKFFLVYTNSTPYWTYLFFTVQHSRSFNTPCCRGCLENWNECRSPAIY